MIAHRNATHAELEQVLDWAATEGWNPGLDDAAAFHEADPQGFFVAEVGGAPVAAISVVNHTPQFAFLGLYIVRPSHRGRGVGFGLWQHALKHAGQRTVGLDGVPEQQDNYAASGFVHAGATTRFAGSLGPEDPDLQECRAQDIPTLVGHEARASNVSKEAYLSAWYQNTPNRRTFVDRRADRIVGFSTVRKCRQGAKIGPLVAEDAQGAERLLRHAASIFPGDISVDVPEGSTGLSELCTRLGLQPGFRTARMYRGHFETATAPFYAVTSLELG